MKTLSIKTNLLGRGDTFKILAIGQITGFPVLLVGPPGTGKTKALLDYAHGLHNYNAADALKNTFILETDEGTRPAEIKGRVDMKKLLAPGKDPLTGEVLPPVYTLNSPIAKAKMILINEIDKASPGLRNSMLGVMNEKMLFNGEEKVFTPWELFCASCNVIPKEEENNPFWDRFVLKQKLSRLTQSQMMQYYQLKGKAPIDLYMPDENEMNAFIASIPQELLKHMLSVMYKDMSDRSLSYIPKVLAAVSFVYQYSMKKAAIKTCEILTSPEIAKNLAAKLEPKAISDIRNKIEMIKTLQNYDQIIGQIEDIKKSAAAAAHLQDVSKADMEDLAADLNKTLTQNPTYSAGNEAIAEGLKSTSSKTNWNAVTQP